MIDNTSLSINEPSGLIRKRWYSSGAHFWDKDKKSEGYYIGLLPDVGMNTVAISSTTALVISWFDESVFHKARFNLDRHYSHYKIEDSFDVNIKNLTSNLSSPWYGDAVWIELVDSNNTIMLITSTDDQMVEQNEYTNKSNLRLLIQTESRIESSY